MKLNTSKTKVAIKTNLQQKLEPEDPQPIGELVSDLKVLGTFIDRDSTRVAHVLCCLRASTYHMYVL